MWKKNNNNQEPQSSVYGSLTDIRGRKGTSKLGFAVLGNGPTVEYQRATQKVEHGNDTNVQHKRMNMNDEMMNNPSRNN